MLAELSMQIDNSFRILFLIHMNLYFEMLYLCRCLLPPPNSIQQYISDVIIQFHLNDRIFCTIMI